MKAEQLLKICRDRGITVVVANGNLELTPKDAITEALREALKKYKADLVALLAPAPEPPEEPELEEWVPYGNGYVHKDHVAEVRFMEKYERPEPEK